MAARKDTVEISIAFLTDESKQYAKLVKDNKDFIKELQQAKKEGKDLTEVINKMAESGKAIAKIPLDKLAPTQLITRAQQLKQVLDTIPQSAPQYKILEAEYKAINNQLAEMKVRTKGVADEQKKSTGLFSQGLGAVVGWIGGIWGALTALQALFRRGLELDGLGKKFQTVFGSAQGIVIASAHAMAAAVGLSQKKFIELATAAGDLIKPMGFTEKITARLSVLLTEQAGRLNEWTLGAVKTEEAHEILTKSLLGERDALNQLGIDVKDSIIKDELKRRGMEKLTGESRRQAEAIITLDLVQRQSSSANAAFAQNQDSAARNVARANAAWKEFTDRIAGNLIGAFKDLTGWFGSLLPKQETLRESTERMQLAMNAEFEILKKGNFSQEERGRLIQGINERYGEYLPNLISEKASIAEIARVQEKANNLFQQKILYLAMEEQIAEVVKKSKDATNLAFGAEQMRVSNLQKLRDPKLYDDGRLADFYAESAKLSENIRDQSLDTVRNAPKEVEAIEKQFSALAERLGSTMEKIRQQFSLKNDRTLSDELERIKKTGEYEPEKKKKKKTASTEIDISKVSFEEQIAIAVEQLGEKKISTAEAQEKRLTAVARSGSEQRLDEFSESEKARYKNAEAQAAARDELDKREKDAAIEREKKLRAERQASFDATASALGQAFSLTAEYLEKDDASRKKNSKKIKALRKGEVIVSGISEVQKIWAHAAEFGIFAPIVGALLTAVAVARTGLALRNVESAKFAAGGFTGPGYGAPDTSGHRPAGVVHAGEWVSPAWMVQHPQYGRQVALLESVRQRGFAAGGFVDTSPAPSPNRMPETANTAGEQEARALRAEFAAMRRDVNAWQRSLRVAVVHSDIEQAAAQKRALVEAVGI